MLQTLSITDSRYYRHQIVVPRVSTIMGVDCSCFFFAVQEDDVELDEFPVDPEVSFPTILFCFMFLFNFHCQSSLL